MNLYSQSHIRNDLNFINFIKFNCTKYKIFKFPNINNSIKNFINNIRKYCIFCEEYGNVIKVYLYDFY